ncbi:hypothetical protein SCHPADRAFT_943191 [Schizopora paradoxa]|uniref:Uncharacterized protein n=1 Tax=Schizopora paradoxa TaxID=27342 RepID=A0A0H2REP9_9AGAM|nr:hypothetical protein SCHPADRAFT_943191 [Schizopora paradoxa]
MAFLENLDVAPHFPLDSPPSAPVTQLLTRRVETSVSSIASDATAPNLPGAGRTVGILLDWLGARLETVLNKRAESLGYGPHAVAEHIRVLCHHADTSIVERHGATLPLQFSLTRTERKRLKTLCKKLLKHANAEVLDTQLVALNEIISLSIEDPHVRALLQSCDHDRLLAKYSEPDLIMTTSKALGSIKNVQVHSLWSRILPYASSSSAQFSRCGFGEIAYRSYNFAALEASLRDPDSSFLAAQYLMSAYELAANLSDAGQSRKAKSRLDTLWKGYIKAAISNPSIIEWENINHCLMLTDPSLTTVTFRSRTSDYEVHVSEESLVPLAVHLLKEATRVPMFFSHYFAAPKIALGKINESCTPVLFTYTTAVWGCEWDTLEGASSCVEFLQVLSGSYDLDIQLSCLHWINVKFPGLTKGTIFANDLVILFLHTTYHILQSYLCDPPSLNCVYEPIRSSVWRLSLYACTRLADYLKVGKLEDKALASFLISRLVSMDRYCKLSVLHATRKWGEPMLSYLPSGHSTWEIARLSQEGCHQDRHSTVMQFQSENTLFLVRYRAHGAFYVAPPYFPVPIDFLEDPEFTVDIMVIDDREVVHLPIDGKLSPFKENGHYPISAGCNNMGSKFYVSLAITNKDFAFNNYFGNTIDSNNMTYVDRTGKLCTH